MSCGQVSREDVTNEHSRLERPEWIDRPRNTQVSPREQSNAPSATSKFVIAPGAVAAQVELHESAPLFVGNLSPNCTDQDLIDAFSAHGTLLYVRIMKTRKKTLLGYAFVTMATLQDAERAMKALDMTLLCGRTLHISIAGRNVLGEKPAAGASTNPVTLLKSKQTTLAEAVVEIAGNKPVRGILTTSVASVGDSIGVAPGGLDKEPTSNCCKRTVAHAGVNCAKQNASADVTSNLTVRFYFHYFRPDPKWAPPSIAKQTAGPSTVTSPHAIDTYHDLSYPLHADRGGVNKYVPSFLLSSASVPCPPSLGNGGLQTAAPTGKTVTADTIRRMIEGDNPEGAARTVQNVSMEQVDEAEFWVRGRGFINFVDDTERFKALRHLSSVSKDDVHFILIGEPQHRDLRQRSKQAGAATDDFKLPMNVDIIPLEENRCANRELGGECLVEKSGSASYDIPAVISGESSPTARPTVSSEYYRPHIVPSFSSPKTLRATLSGSDGASISLHNNPLRTVSTRYYRMITSGDPK